MTISKKASPEPSKSGKDDGTKPVLSPETLALAEKGIIKHPQFYGNQNSSAKGQGIKDLKKLGVKEASEGPGSHLSFLSALGAASNFSGFAIGLLSNLKNTRDNNYTNWHLTFNELSEIEKFARNISSYGNISFDDARDFLLILVSIDVLDDMKKISLAIDLPELDNPDILRKPLEILAVPRLAKVAYLASSLTALLKAFSKYLNIQKLMVGDDDTDTGVFNALSNSLGGFGSFAGFGGLSVQKSVESIISASGSDQFGHKLTEIVLGKLIPTTILAKNPNAVSPSHIGKTMFGELANGIPLTDINQLFAKTIAAYNKPASGSGTLSFGLQNFSNFVGSQTSSSLINKILFGSDNITLGSAKEAISLQLINDFNNLTGISSTEILDINRADIAIPFMSGLSAIQSSLDKPPFPIGTFQQGWILANGVSNMMQQNFPDFFKGIRGL